MSKFFFESAVDISLILAKEFAARRHDKEHSIEQTAEITGLSKAVISTFEETGEISLQDFIKITVQYGFIENFNGIFPEPIPQKIKDGMSDL